MGTLAVIKTEKLTSKHARGITRHHLSNGWWIDEDPRASRNVGHRFGLWRPRSNPRSGKWVKSANSIKTLLKAAGVQAMTEPGSDSR